MNGDRLACISIPQFPGQVAVKDSPGLGKGPLVIAEREGDSSPLVSLNRHAVRSELVDSMTVAQARGRCPEVRVVVRNREREDEESGKLLKLLQSVGPFIEEDTPGRYFLQASGLTRLYKSENRLAQKILGDLQPSLYPLQVGIAANKLVSRIAAGLSGVYKYIIVPGNGERQFLAPLPVDRLFLPPETVSKLYDLGIKTIRHLAQFPAHEITQRFGGEVVELADYARGKDETLFVPERLSAGISRKLILDYPIHSSTMLLTHLEPMLEELLGMLSVSGQGSRALAIEFGCDDKSKGSLHITVDQPTSSVKLFSRQIYRRLERQTLRAGITEIKVIIPETLPLAAEQTGLYHQPAAVSKTVSLEKDYGTLASSMYSVEKQSRPLPEEGHKLAPFTLPKKHGRKNAVPEPESPHAMDQLYAGRKIYGLRLLTPPREINVEKESGVVTAIYLKRRKLRVINRSGPWKLSGGWWARGSAPFNRLYYEIETENRKTFLLFFDRVLSTWFIQGVFD